MYKVKYNNRFYALNLSLFIFRNRVEADPAENNTMFRATRVLLDGRNRFSKVVRISQMQKRNTRRRIKIVQQNSVIIREGRQALNKVNARIIAEYEAGVAAAANAGSETQHHTSA